MKKLKICVYAICKDEEKFVKRWLDSMEEADCICVLDTGSTDNTVKLLKENKKVIVKQKVINPWRFDDARNESLKLIPNDVDFCVCTDLDEIFEKGWRKKLEENILPTTKLVYYKYVWNFNEDGTEGVTFFANKIHKNKEFCWKNPVHEVITYLSNDIPNAITIKDLQLNHYADNNKSRSQYLPLLELAVKEDPQNDRNMHYLGREYYFYGQYDNAIKTLKKHLSLKSAKWSDERSASLRYIANSYANLNKNRLAEKYFKLSIAETPKNREPYYELAKFYYKQQKYLDSVCMLESMLNINERQLNYISNPECWSYSVYDILSISYFNLKNKEKSLINCYKAMQLNPTNQRIVNNYNIIKNANF